MADIEDARREVDKMLSCLALHSQDDSSFDVLLHYAKPLPLAALVKVRESVQRRGIVGVGYAVNALKSEARERNG